MNVAWTSNFIFHIYTVGTLLATDGFSESKGHPSVVTGLPQLETNYRVELGFYMLSDSVWFLFFTNMPISDF